MEMYILDNCCARKHRHTLKMILIMKMKVKIKSENKIKQKHRIKRTTNLIAQSSISSTLPTSFSKLERFKSKGAFRSQAPSGVCIAVLSYGRTCHVVFFKIILTYTVQKKKKKVLS